MSDIVKMCKNFYGNDPDKKKEIHRFWATYTRNKVIQLYTSADFIHGLLNSALRTEDINALYSFRLLIVDLCDQLKEQHRQHCSGQTKLTVYHGQYMDISEIDELRGNIGKLMSINSFWSTSFDENVAMMFAGAGQTRPEQFSVLFQIDVDTGLKSTFFAPIEKLSMFPDEREFLFELRSVFEIKKIQLDSEKNCYLVHLAATDEGHEKYEEYRNILHKEADSDNIHIVFGCLMISMGKHYKAVDYFAKLPERLSNNDVVLQGIFRRYHARALYLSGNYKQAHDLLKEGLAIYDKNNVSFENINYLQLQFNLANVYVFMKQYKDALELYQRVLDTQQRVLPPDHRDIGGTLSGLGWVYGELSKPQESIEYATRALELFRRVLPSNHPTISKSINRIAGLFKERAEFDLALRYHKEALEMSERYLPKDHPTIATILREIGDIYESKRDLRLGLEYYLRSYNIQKNNYSNGHILVANTLQVIGNIYRYFKQYDEALKYHYQSLEMREKLQPPDNFLCKHDLGEIYLEMGNIKEAIVCFEFAYKARSHRFGPEHASTILTKSLLDIAYSESGDFTRAKNI